VIFHDSFDSGFQTPSISSIESRHTVPSSKVITELLHVPSRKTLEKHYSVIALLILKLNSISRICKKYIFSFTWRCVWNSTQHKPRVFCALIMSETLRTLLSRCALSASKTRTSPTIFLQTMQRAQINSTSSLFAKRT